jgi:hypothetical protein
MMVPTSPWPANIPIEGVADLTVGVVSAEGRNLSMEFNAHIGNLSGTQVVVQVSTIKPEHWLSANPFFPQKLLGLSI